MRMHGITDVIPNVSSINYKDRRIPPSPELSRYVDHRSSPGMTPGSYSSIAPAANAWQSPSTWQGDTVAKHRHPVHFINYVTLFSI